MKSDHVVLFSSLLLLLSCTVSRPPIGPVLPPAQAAKLYQNTNYQVSYRWIKQHVFRTCTYCHPNNKADMFTYPGIVKLLVPGDPENSKLYQMIYTGQMPPGGMRMAKPDIQVIYDWIQQGAPDN